MYKTSPCFNCEVRELGCHDSCEDYKKYRDKIDKAAENKRKVLNYDYIGYQIDKKKRLG